MSPNYTGTPHIIEFGVGRNLTVAAFLILAASFNARSSPQHDAYQPTAAAEPPELSGITPVHAQAPSSEIRALASAVEAVKEASPEEVRRTLTEVIRQYPAYPDAYYMRLMLGYCQNNTPYPAMMDDINDALRYFSPTKESMIDSPQELYALRSKLEYDQGAHEQAVDDLEHAVLLDTHMAGKLLDEHVVVTPDTKSIPCAWTLANLNYLAKELPKDYRIPIFIGLWYDFHGFYDNKYYASALPSFEHALALKPKIGLIHYYIGQHIETTLSASEKLSTSSEPTENDKKLLSEYNAALTLDPTLAPAYMALANIHIYLKHPTLALGAYNKAIDLRPNEHEFYNRRAQLLMDMGRDREAISDFTRAIDNCRDSALLQAYYQQRAEMYLRVGAFGEAVSDYSTTIRLLLETVIPNLLGLKQFRRVYPEYASLSDQAVSAKLQALLRPGWQPGVFLKSFTAAADDTDIGATELAGNYTHRAAAYWLSRDYRKAITDYQRVFNGFPKYVKDNPDTLDRWKPFFLAADSEEYIDVRTVDYSQPTAVKLWLKTVEKKSGKPAGFRIQEMNVNCTSKLIGFIYATNYDAKGNTTGSLDTATWHKIVPDTLGEALYEGMCK